MLGPHVLLEASRRIRTGDGSYVQAGAVASKGDAWSGGLVAKMDLFL
jgi:hypothetical protein